MEINAVPADPEGDAEASAEHLQPESLPDDVAQGWEEDDPTTGAAPTG